MAKINSQGTAIRIADEKARKTGKKTMVVYNHKTGYFSVRLKSKYTVNEELVYYSR